jgi:polysaccharide chain length determinant protein (PEP-CTERM system associated)
LPEPEEGSLNLDETAARLFEVLARRRWWILLPFCVVSVATVAALSLIPNRYTSTATLLVVQQQVPQRYVVPNSETNVTSALQAMKQEILSRTQLLRMINEFGLYPKQRKRMPPEQLFALMLSNIDVQAIVQDGQARDKDLNAFQISFTTEGALLAQQVTNNLTSLFSNEYIRNQAEQATNTTDFLHRQVEDKSKELEAQEMRLKDFKLSHVGELPEQQTGNLGILTGLQGQLQNTMASLGRAQEQRALLQAQLDATQRRRPTSEPGAFGFVPGNSTPTQLLSPIQGAQNNLTLLEAERLRLFNKGDTSQHPDVIRIQREIAEAQDKLKRLQAAAPAPEKAAPSAQSATNAPPAFDISEDPVAAQLKSSLEGNRVEIENLTSEQKRLTASISQYENRINQTPVREQQEAGILRDTEVLRQQYSDLQKKEQESQLATNLEKQQGGRQFRLIDPASLPIVPSYPKRFKMSFGGAVGGLVLGLALALLMEMRDTSYHSESDLTKHLAPPFVLGIPLLPTPLEKRKKKWNDRFQWAAATAMVFVVLAAEFFVYKRG